VLGGVQIPLGAGAVDAARAHDRLAHDKQATRRSERRRVGACLVVLGGNRGNRGGGALPPAVGSRCAAGDGLPAIAVPKSSLCGELWLMRLVGDAAKGAHVDL